MLPPHDSFAKIIEVLNELREKCPWDKVQTKETLRHLTLEEVYELSDAILKDDWQEIKTELGDVLLHILFYAKIAEEQNQFTAGEMIDSLVEKLIRRHPHIYGETKVDSAEQVKENWEKIKKEKICISGSSRQYARAHQGYAYAGKSSSGRL